MAYWPHRKKLFSPWFSQAGNGRMAWVRWFQSKRKDPLSPSQSQNRWKKGCESHYFGIRLSFSIFLGLQIYYTHLRYNVNRWSIIGLNWSQVRWCFSMWGPSWYLGDVANLIVRLVRFVFLKHKYNDTSSTAQGDGGSFKNRKPIGEVGCCDSWMAERIH